MVFDVMGDNLLKLITQSNYKGIPIESVRTIIRQVLQGLHYLHEKCQIIHTDIKPENILLTIDESRVRRMHSEVENLIQNFGEHQLESSFVSTAPLSVRKQFEDYYRNKRTNSKKVSVIGIKAENVNNYEESKTTTGKNKIFL
jgi:serine/threonine protein kinase